MLEKKLTGIKRGLTAVVTALSFYGCSTMDTSYPLAGKVKGFDQINYCDGDDGRHLYCDDKFIYPAVVVEFK